MAENYVLLETIQLSQSATSVTFDNLPSSGYDDLKLVISSRDDFASVSTNLGMKINGSSTGLSGRVLFGTGTTASSTTVTDSVGYNVGSSGTASTYAITELYIPKYKETGIYKSFSGEAVAESNTATVYMQMLAGLWSNNGAITSLNFYPVNATNFVAGSTFSLYGVASLGTTPAIAPFASGGNIVANDGTYWYHAFLSSGAFVPFKNLTCDVLQIAGGGGGAGYNNHNLSGQKRGSPGGAGGLLAFTGESITTSTNVTVGAGGAGNTGFDGSPYPTRNGTQGVNSQFGSLTASVGGGYGAGGQNTAGGNGGSGGGGCNGGAGGSPTSGQGNSGGAGDGSFAGGGGGAGAAGQAAVFLSYQGNGGNGLSTYSSWGLATNTGQNISGTVWYAGGGSNNTPGNGGGGGANINGTAATGGGGGGDTTLTSGSSAGNGGSGVVIVRYLMSS